MAEHIPHYFPADEFTLTTTGAVTGGQVVEVTGNMTCAATGGASLKVVGVAAYDAASGAQVHVYREGVHDLLAVGAIAAGDLVVSAAGGGVASLAAVTTPTAGDVTGTREVIGRALEAISDTARGRILLTI